MAAQAALYIGKTVHSVYQDKTSDTLPPLLYLFDFHVSTMGTLYKTD